MLLPPDLSHAPALEIAALDAIMKVPAPIDSVLSDNKRTAAEQLDLERVKIMGTADGTKIVDDIDDCLKRKLYHQLMLNCDEYLFDEKYSSFWSDWTEKAIFCQNVLYSVRTKVDASKLLKITEKLTSQGGEGLSALKFLNLWLDVMKADRDTLLLFRSAEAYYLLHGGFHKECSVLLIDVLAKIVNSAFGLSVPTLSAYYRARTTYHAHMNDWDSVYEQGILYLACTSLEDITVPERIALAFNLCKAVLIGRSSCGSVELRNQALIHWFSEKSGAPEAWIFDVIRIFDIGDQVGFNDFVNVHRQKFVDAGLDGEIEYLKRKIKLFSLLELAFHKPQKSRSLTFDEISTGCYVEKNQVEELLLVAMSLGLVEGKIDGIKEVFMIRKIQPRLLNTDKILTMASRFQTWSKTASDLARVMAQAQDSSVSI